MYDGLSEEQKRDHWKNLIEGANQFGKIASEYGVKLAFHPHDHTLVFKRGDIVRFLNDTDANYVGLTFDTAHFAWAGMKVIEELEVFRSRVSHVHLKDLKEGEFVELGKGTLPLREFLESLLRGGYDGWMTIELDATEEPVASATASVTHLQKLLAQIQRLK
jgi:inosose dehydratase